MADVYADAFAGTEPEQPLELAMIEHFVGLLAEPRRVLDAGCGAGRMLPFLDRLGCCPEGVDLSPRMIGRAQADHPEFRTRVGALSNLDYPDASFDGVFAWYSIIHHPDGDVERMLAELGRVLRPGGCLLLAFQTRVDVRRVGEGFRARGLTVEMIRYHRELDDVAARLAGAGFAILARLERAPCGAEADPQGVLIARKPSGEALTPLEAGT